MILMFTWSLENMAKGGWLGRCRLLAVMGKKKGEKTFLSSGSQLWKICPLSKYLAMTVDTFIVTTGGLLLASGRERLLSILTMHITAPFPQQRMI